MSTIAIFDITLGEHRKALIRRADYGYNYYYMHWIGWGWKQIGSPKRMVVDDYGQLVVSNNQSAYSLN